LVSPIRLVHRTEKNNVGGFFKGGICLKKRQFRNRKKKTFHKQKICRFCADSSLAIDYKDFSMLRFFVTERGKIIPRRISGNCARHQRRITNAVKRARNIALIPFTVAH